MSGDECQAVLLRCEVCDCDLCRERTALVQHAQEVLRMAEAKFRQCPKAVAKRHAFATYVPPFPGKS